MTSTYIQQKTEKFTLIYTGLMIKTLRIANIEKVQLSDALNIHSMTMGIDYLWPMEVLLPYHAWNHLFYAATKSLYMQKK